MRTIAVATAASATLFSATPSDASWSVAAMTSPVDHAVPIGRKRNDAPSPRLRSTTTRDPAVDEAGLLHPRSP